MIQVREKGRPMLPTYLARFLVSQFEPDCVSPYVQCCLKVRPVGTALGTGHRLSKSAGGPTSLLTAHMLTAHSSPATLLPKVLVNLRHRLTAPHANSKVTLHTARTAPSGTGTERALVGVGIENSYSSVRAVYLRMAALPWPLKPASAVSASWRLLLLSASCTMVSAA